MIYHATVVLSLCLCLLTPWAASAQTKQPALPAQPQSSDPLAEEASDEPAEPTQEEAPPYPAPPSESAEDTAVPAETPGSTKAQLTAEADSKATKADEARCSQLMAQGQAALAQAEGCGGGDQRI